MTYPVISGSENKLGEAEDKKILLIFTVVASI